MADGPSPLLLSLLAPIYLIHQSPTHLAITPSLQSQHPRNPSLFIHPSTIHHHRQLHPSTLSIHPSTHPSAGPDSRCRLVIPPRSYEYCALLLARAIAKRQLDSLNHRNYLSNQVKRKTPSSLPFHEKVRRFFSLPPVHACVRYLDYSASSQPRISHQSAVSRWAHIINDPPCLRAIK